MFVDSREMKDQDTAIMCSNVKLAYICLTSLITMSACQHHVHMDGSDPQNVKYEAGAIPLETRLVPMDTDEKDLTVSNTSSSDSTGSCYSYSATSARSVSITAGSSVSVKNELSHTLHGQVNDMSLSDKDSTYHNREKDSVYALKEHKAWFNTFVTALAYKKNSHEFIEILNKGKKYLGRVIDWEDDTYTPMHYAAKCGDLEVVKILAAKPYSVPLDLKAGEHQRTPCHFAALMGNLAVISYLIEKMKNFWTRMISMNVVPYIMLLQASTHRT